MPVVWAGSHRTHRSSGSPLPFNRPGLMGISMRLYLAPDSDLYAFGGAPRTMQAWIRYPRSTPDVSLQEYWQDLEAILFDEAAGRPSPFRPQGADFTYPFIADHGAYALSSTSTLTLLQRIDQVARPQVEAYVQRRWAGLTVQAGHSPELTPVQLSAQTEELLLYLSRLREACTLAARTGYGLLMALWEER